MRWFPRVRRPPVADIRAAARQAVAYGRPPIELIPVLRARTPPFDVLNQAAAGARRTREIPIVSRTPAPRAADSQ